MNLYSYYTIYSFLTAFSVFISFTKFLIYELTLKQKSVLLCFSFIITFLYMNFSLLCPSAIYSSSLVIGTLFIIIVCAKKECFINFIFAVLNHFLYLCLNNLMLFLCNHYFFSYTEKNFASRCLFLYLQCLLFYPIFTFLGGLLRKFYLRKLFPVYTLFYHSKTKYLLYFELAICLAIGLFNIAYSKITNHPQTVITLNTLTFLAFFLLTGIVLYLTFESLLKEQHIAAKLAESKALQDYTARLENLYMDIRCFKHDYMNILSSFQGFLLDKNYDGLSNYFNNTILPAGQNLAAQDISFGKLGNLKVPEIKGIVYTKIFSAFIQKLHITLDIPKPVFSFPMETTDLLRVLGILLDNALEASSKTEEKIFTVGFLNAEHYIYIQIQNSSPEIQDVSTLFQLNVSSKENHTGTGLYEVRKLIEQYENVLLNTEYQNNRFSQTLQLYKCKQQ